MFGILERISSIVGYWYFRYLLVTELYMVEKWERYFIHAFLMTMFALLFFFNYKILLPSTSQIFVPSSILVD